MRKARKLAARGLIVHRGELLLSYDSEDDCWALPGGSIEHGESAVDTVIRELDEETQLGPLGAFSHLTVFEHRFIWRDLDIHELTVVCRTDLDPETDYDTRARESHLRFEFHKAGKLDEIDFRPRGLADFIADAMSGKMVPPFIALDLGLRGEMKR